MQKVSSSQSYEENDVGPGNYGRYETNQRKDILATKIRLTTMVLYLKVLKAYKATSTNGILFSQSICIAKGVC